MLGFESTPSVSTPENEQSRLSPEDQAVMNRRRFLAGAAGMVASVAAPEVMATPEEDKNIVTLRGFYTRDRGLNFSRELTKIFPNARAVEFALLREDGETITTSLSVPANELVHMRLIVSLEDGRQMIFQSKRGWNNNPSGHMVLCLDLIEDAAKKR